jgi:hypothetical protein
VAFDVSNRLPPNQAHKLRVSIGQPVFLPGKPEVEVNTY